MRKSIAQAYWRKNAISLICEKQLEQDDAADGENSACHQQQNQSEFDDLPGKTQIALVARQQVNGK